jgi:hypothetical protein
VACFGPSAADGAAFRADFCGTLFSTRVAEVDIVRRCMKNSHTSQKDQKAAQASMGASLEHGHGSLWNNPLTRRRFMRRTGTVTVAVAIAGLGTLEVLAVDSAAPKVLQKRFRTGNGSGSTYTESCTNAKADAEAQPWSAWADDVGTPHNGVDLPNPNPSITYTGSNQSRE